MLDFEKQFWLSHPSDSLAGVDEAGRGPLAGPVVAAAVSISFDSIEALQQGPLKAVNDSKQLSEKQREALFASLTQSPAVSWGIGIASSQEIDAINILRATHLAMARALHALPDGPPHHALVDGLPPKGLPCPSTAIVKGDSKSFLIAAASILAKVTRDRALIELHQQYPQYGFNQHKGYPTPEHLAALQKYGVCPAHRRSFKPVADLLNPTLFNWIDSNYEPRKTR